MTSLIDLSDHVSKSDRGQTSLTERGAMTL
jgi:hypothetical protein